MQPVQQKTNVFVSDYLKNQKQDTSLYAKLRDKIESKCSKLLKQQPDIEISITMSAKYQTPRIMISEKSRFPQNLQHLEAKIIEALQEAGIGSFSAEERADYYIIDFSV